MIKCRFCENAFNWELLNIHETTVHSDSLFDNVPNLNDFFKEDKTTNSELNNHNEIKPIYSIPIPLPPPLPKTSSAFHFKKSEESLIKSINFKTIPTKDYKCCYCERVLLTITSLRRHEKLIHNVIECKNEHFKPEFSMYESQKPKMRKLDQDQIEFMRKTHQLLSLGTIQILRNTEG